MRVRVPAPMPCHVRPGQCVVGARAPPGSQARLAVLRIVGAPALMLRAAGGRRDDVERMLSQDKYLSVLNMHQQDGWTGRRVYLQPRERTRWMPRDSGLTSRLLSRSMPLCGELGLRGHCAAAVRARSGRERADKAQPVYPAAPCGQEVA